MKSIFNKLSSLFAGSAKDKQELNVAKASNPSLSESLQRWIEGIDAQEKIPEDIKALNFGLFEGEDGYMAYLCGATEYDPDDDDWACSDDYTPHQRYLEIKDPKANALEWEQFQELFIDTIKPIL